MSTTHPEGEASASPSPRPLSGGIVGSLHEAFFGRPLTPFPPPYTQRFIPPKTRGERAIAAAGTAIQVAARLCIVVMIVAITLALCIRLFALAV